MKKFVFTLMVTLGFGMASCSQNKTMPDTIVSDSTLTIVDSAVVDTVSVDSVITL